MDRNGGGRWVMATHQNRSCGRLAVLLHNDFQDLLSVQNYKPFT